MKKPKKEMEVGQFKNLMDMWNKMQVNIPFFDALEQILVFAKFMKEIPSVKRKLKHDKNIALEEECRAII